MKNLIKVIAVTLILAIAACSSPAPIHDPETGRTFSSGEVVESPIGHYWLCIRNPRSAACTKKEVPVEEKREKETEDGETNNQTN